MIANPSPLAFGASAVILRGVTVLLVKRAKPPFAGLWSLPGGRIEPGEMPEAAAIRELREEAGLDAVILGFLAHHTIVVDASPRDDPAEFQLAVYYGRTTPRPPHDEPMAGGDAADARFVPLDQLAQYPLTPDVGKFIALAARRFADDRSA